MLHMPQTDTRKAILLSLQPVSTNICPSIGTVTRSDPLFLVDVSRGFTVCADTPSLKIVRCSQIMSVREALTFTQTYTARVASVLPVLLSAIRISPPSEGPAHDGKIIGKEVVSYAYKQVWVILCLRIEVSPLIYSQSGYHHI